MVNLKKTGVYLSLTILFFLLGGCGKNENIAPKMSQYNNYDETMNKTVFIEDAVLDVPKGLVYVGDSLYVTSKEGHCVLKYSKEGILEKTIGNLGNGDGEFRKPVAITYYGEELYVADEEDGKIQVFDLDGSFIRKYYVEELDNIYLFVVDIEADEHNIYVSVTGGEKSLLHVYVISKADGKVDTLGKLSMGSLGRGEENIYFAQEFDYIEENGNSGYESGESYFSEIGNGKMKKIFQLPDGYLPSDILVYENNIYLLSKALTQVDVFNIQGQYIKTVFSEESSVRNRGLGYMTMDAEGNIYLSDEENDVVYKLEKEN